MVFYSLELLGKKEAGIYYCKNKMNSGGRDRHGYERGKKYDVIRSEDGTITSR